MILNLEFIKAIVTSKEAFVLSPSHPVLQQFIQQLHTTFLDVEAQNVCKTNIERLNLDVEESNYEQLFECDEHTIIDGTYEQSEEKKDTSSIFENTRSLQEGKMSPVCSGNVKLDEETTEETIGSFEDYAVIRLSSYLTEDVLPEEAIVSTLDNMRNNIPTYYEEEIPSHIEFSIDIVNIPSSDTMLDPATNDAMEGGPKEDNNTKENSNDTMVRVNDIPMIFDKDDFPTSMELKNTSSSFSTKQDLEPIKSQAPTLDAKYIPEHSFELKFLELALHTTCSYLQTRAKELKTRVIPLSDKVVATFHPLLLRELLAFKKRIATLFFRTQKVSEP